MKSGAAYPSIAVPGVPPALGAFVDARRPG